MSNQSKNHHLPGLRPNANIFEKHAGISVDVLVRVEGWEGIHIGRYLHAIEQWQIDSFHGVVTVSEWWPMPTKGTGTLVKQPNRSQTNEN